MLIFTCLNLNGTSLAMALYGYARVSSIDQDFALQEQTLRAAGCDVVRAGKASGRSRAGRTGLATLPDFLRRGDTLVVTRIDRLARRIKDLQGIVQILKERGVTLKATVQPIDTRSAAGKVFLDMLGVFAEFETNLRRECQQDRYTAPPSADTEGRKPRIRCQINVGGKAQHPDRRPDFGALL